MGGVLSHRVHTMLLSCGLYPESKEGKVFRATDRRRKKEDRTCVHVSLGVPRKCKGCLPWKPEPRQRVLFSCAHYGCISFFLSYC